MNDYEPSIRTYPEHGFPSKIEHEIEIKYEQIVTLPKKDDEVLPHEETIGQELAICISYTDLKEKREALPQVCERLSQSLNREHNLPSEFLHVKYLITRANLIFTLVFDRVNASFCLKVTYSKSE